MLIDDGLTKVSIHGEEDRSEPSPQAAAKSRADITNGRRQVAFWSKLRKTPVGQGQVLEAVRNLRLSLPETQQKFAERLGWALPPWCDGRASGRRPAKPWRSSTIWQSEQGLDGIAAVFRRALSEELGAPPPLPTPGALSIKNEDERDLVSALLEVLRQEPYAKQADAVKRILDPIVAQRRQESEYQAAREAVRNAIVRFLKKNYPVEEAKRAFSTSAENVAEAIFENGDKKLIEERTVEVIGMLLREHWSIGDIAKKFHIDPEEVKSYAIDAGCGKAVMEYQEEQEPHDADQKER